MLDATEILHSLWEGDKKYARVSSVLKCWKKSGLLEGLNIVMDNIEINDEDVDNDFSDGISNILDAMKKIQVVAKNDVSQTSSTPLDNTFAYESFDNTLEMKQMTENWVNVESDKDIQNFEIDQKIEKVFSLTTNGSIASYESDINSLSSEDLEKNQENVMITGDNNVITLDEADDYFHKITQFAEKNKVPDDMIQKLHSIHRDIRKHSLMQKTKTKTSNPSILSFFKNVTEV